jgi:DNA-damage-inducible protein J
MATKTATLNARIEPRLKRAAERVFAKLRLSPTEAVRLFYRQVELRHGMPFDLCVPNPETAAAIAELNSGGGRAYRGTGEEVVGAILDE